MPRLILWKNQEINKLRKDMDRLLERLCDDFGMPLFPRTTRDVPSIDLSETEDNLVVHAEIPGIDPDDLEISVIDNRLHIKGEMKHETVDEGSTYHRVERRYGSFSRNIQLPCRVIKEDVTATYKEGILTIVMPKCRPETTRSFKIKIT